MSLVSLARGAPAPAMRPAFAGLALVAALVLTLLAPAFAADGSIVVTLKQVSSDRYLDAWDDGTNDFGVVTRPSQNNNSQLWRITWIDSGIGTLQQLSTGRFLDAHEITGKDFQLVTRPEQGNTTQNWSFVAVGGGLYAIEQLSSKRFIDAHEIAERDFAVVTRPRQDNNTQLWELVIIEKAK